MLLNNALKSLLLVFLCVLAGPAEALDFNGFWLYRTAGGEGRETRQEFQERYSLGAGPQFAYQPSQAITATGAIGYTRGQRSSGTDTVETEQISPSAGITLSNDLFTASLAGTATRFSGSAGGGDTSRSWDATLANGWDLPLWPSIRLNYGESDSAQNSLDLFSRSGNLQRYSSLNVDWDLLLARLNYRYSTTSDEDRDNGSLLESANHFIRVETDGRLLADRVSYSLSQQYQQGTRDFSVDALDGEGMFPLEGSKSGKVDALTDPEPVDFDYADPDVSLDSSPVDPPLSIETNTRIHLSFGNPFGLPQQIDLVRLYFERDAEQAAALSWALYYREPGDDRWLATGSVIVGQYNAAEDAVDIAVDLEANEILLVAVNDTGIPLALTGMRVFSQLTAADASSSTNQSLLTTAGLGVKLTKTLNATVNLTQEHLENDSGEQVTTADRRTLSGRLRWTPFPWLAPSLGFSENSEEQSGALERVNRFYSITVATIPLPTMNVTFGVTQGERFVGDWKTDETVKYLISTTARIYPDLNASMFLGHQQDLRRGEEEDAEFVESTALTGRLNLNARLSRNLTSDFVVNYRSSEQQSGPVDTANTILSLQYRPSGYLSLRGTYTAYFLDSTQENGFGGGMALALLRTYKTRLNLTYSVSMVEDVSHNIGLNGSWDISRNLSLLTQGNYNMTETNSYSIQSSLNLRF